jgi:hypothetical protein
VNRLCRSHLGGDALVAIGLALALAAPLAHADGRIEARSEGTCPVLFRSIEVAGPRLRFEVSAPRQDQDYVSIFDGDEDLVTGLMPAQRTYMRMEVDEDAADYSGDVAGSMVKYMDRQMAQVAEQMQRNCPNGGCPQMPDLNALMRAGMPQGAAPIEARDTPETGTAAGAACRWREWVQAGAVVRRECLANLADLPLPERDRAGLVRGMKVMLRFNAAYAPMRDRFGLDVEPVSPPGQVPVAQACFAGGAPTGTVEVSVVEAPVDPSRFEIPAGYTALMGPGPEGP